MQEAYEACEAGVDEIDMVLNVGKFMDQEYVLSHIINLKGIRVQ
jgi:deoxyribose-phosphate aldolase